MNDHFIKSKKKKKKEMNTITQNKKKYWVRHAPIVSLTCGSHTCRTHMSVRQWAHAPVSQDTFSPK